MKQHNTIQRALRGFVVLDGVFHQEKAPSMGGFYSDESTQDSFYKEKIPPSWYQYSYESINGQRIERATTLDDVRDACVRIDQAGLQPVVIVPGASSEALFCIQYATDTGPEVEYALCNVQPINILDILGRPDDTALEAWSALVNGTELASLPQWPQSYHTLKTFGESWCEWVTLSADERAPDSLRIERSMQASEFIPLIREDRSLDATRSAKRNVVVDDEANQQANKSTDNTDIYFVHQTAPFAILRMNRVKQQLIPEGALLEVPEGLKYADFIERLYQSQVGDQTLGYDEYDLDGLDKEKPLENEQQLKSPFGSLRRKKKP